MIFFQGINAPISGQNIVREKISILVNNMNKINILPTIWKNRSCMRDETRIPAENKSLSGERSSHQFMNTYWPRRKAPSCSQWSSAWTNQTPRAQSLFLLHGRSQYNGKCYVYIIKKRLERERNNKRERSMAYISRRIWASISCTLRRWFM